MYDKHRKTSRFMKRASSSVSLIELAGFVTIALMLVASLLFVSSTTGRGDDASTSSSSRQSRLDTDRNGVDMPAVHSKTPPAVTDVDAIAKRDPHILPSVDEFDTVEDLNDELMRARKRWIHLERLRSDPKWLHEIEGTVTEPAQTEDSASLNREFEKQIHQVIVKADDFLDYRPERYTNKGHVKFNKESDDWSAVNRQWKKHKELAGETGRPQAVIVTCGLCKTGSSALMLVALKFHEELADDAKVILVGRFDDNFGAFAQSVRGLNGGNNFFKEKWASKIDDMLDDDRLVGWFTNQMVYRLHPKLISIPMGIHTTWKGDVIRAEYLKARSKGPLSRLHLLGVPFRPRGGDATFRTRVFTYATTTLRENFGKQGYRVASIGDNCTSEDRPEICPGFSAYYNLLRTSQFCISPPGLGYDCFRTYESLLFGCIPILISSPNDRSYKGIPVVIVRSFTDITPQFLLAAGRRLLEEFDNTDMLMRLTNAYWSDLIENTAKFPHDALIRQHPADRIDSNLTSKWFDEAWEPGRVKLAERDPSSSIETTGFNEWLSRLST